MQKHDKKNFGPVTFAPGLVALEINPRYDMRARSPNHPTRARALFCFSSFINPDY
jgi:hypothetical protein